MFRSFKVQRDDREHQIHDWIIGKRGWPGSSEAKPPESSISHPGGSAVASTPATQPCYGIRFSFVILLLVLSTNQLTSAAEPASLEELLTKIHSKHKVPCLGGAIIVGDEVSAIGVVGVREKGEDAKATSDDLFHLGSCTKAMTATLCAKLIDQGKLRWDSTIAEVLPNWKDRMHEDYQSVTLEQLLKNRGGMPGAVEPGLWLQVWSKTNDPMKSRRVLLLNTLKNKPAAQPGTKYIYSNTGFTMAGHMAETVAGMPYEKLMEQELFQPLKMNSAGFGSPGSANAIDQPRGHNKDGKVYPPGENNGSDNPTGIAPAGRVHCTIADWGKFISLHINGYQGKSDFLKPETFQRLHKAYPGNGSSYGAGWLVLNRRWSEGITLTHSGSNTLWYCEVWVAPKKNFAVLSVSNQGGSLGQQATRAVINELIPLHVKP